MTLTFSKFDSDKALLPPRKSRVLVVEDHEGCVMVTTAYLDLYGYSYDVTGNGEDAVRLATTGDYSLILMDVKMQGIDGLEATRRIREFENKNHRKPVTIIGITAYAFHEDKERCTAAGMDDYISKPIDYPHFDEKLKQFAS